MKEKLLVEHISKRYDCFSVHKTMMIMEAILSGFHKLMPVNYCWALRDIFFFTKSGEILDIVGHNGAGKSTLLQLLSRVVSPTEGYIKSWGKMRALLDLGAGLHGDLTSRENLIVSAVVAELSRREVRRRFEKIVDFAEINQFIDNPVRTYRKGMRIRLAFSIAIHIDPDILLVDECLSVGDLLFQSKCLHEI